MATSQPPILSQLHRFFHRRLISTSVTSTSRRWGLVSDIHFQEYELPRIVATTDWVLETFRQQAPKLTSIICLGDILNTKENVNVQALSATIQFFGQLRRIAPVHVVLGNHDMNLRTGGSDGSVVSSLDWLDGFGYGDRDGYPCRVYKRMEKAVIDSHDCLMVPWHENHYDVIDGVLQTYPDVDSRSDTILFGHLAIEGATERWVERSRSKICSAAVNEGHLRGFKACWMGHFHHHQRLGKKDDETGVFAWKSNTGYVGAPMQHHFGDKSDKGRGVVILNVDEIEEGAVQESRYPSYEFLRNPAWDLFREVALGKLKLFEESCEVDVAAEGSIEKLKQHLGFDPMGKRIQIFCRALDNHLFEEWRAKLINMGALDVRRRIDQGSLLARKPGQLENESEVSAAASIDHEQEAMDKEKANLGEEYVPPPPSFVDLVEPFVKAVVEKSKQKDSKVSGAISLIPEELMDYYISTGRSIMQRADENTTSTPLQPFNSPASRHDDPTKSSLPVFTATPHKLTMINFLGVQGTLIIPFHKLPQGTYFLQGPNGSGKSTLLEAVTWCLFGRCIRSNMSAADVVNDTVKPVRTPRTRGPGRVTTSVRLEFDNGYVIERSRKSGERTTVPTLKVYYSGEEYMATQESLERDIIGADYGTFVRAIVFGGGGGELTGTGKPIGGGTVDFLGLEKEKRRELIEELLGMGRFEGYAAEAKDLKRSVETQWDELKVTRNYLEEKIGELEESRKSLGAQIGPQRAMLEKLERQMVELDEERGKFEEDLKLTERGQGEAIKWNAVYNKLEKIKDLKKRLEEQQVISEEVGRELETLVQLKPAQALIENLNAGIKTEEKSVSEAERKLTRLKETINQQTKELEMLEKNVEDKVCPTCEQTLPLKNLEIVLERVKEIEKLREAAKLKMRDAINELRELQEKINDKDKRKSEELSKLYGFSVRSERHLGELTSPTRERELRRIYKSHRELLENLIQKYESADAHNVSVMLQGRTPEEIAVLANRKEGDSGTPGVVKQYQFLLKQIQELSDRHMSLSNSHTRLSTQISIAEVQLREASAELIVCRNELEACLGKFSNIEKELRVSNFWEFAFSGKRTSTTVTPNMRSYLLESSISELNALIAANMDILAPPESKGRLSLQLSSDLNIIGSGIYAYGKRSTGQRKRNNLAVLFALFQLVRQKCRFRPEFIMLDEIFDALDKDGQRAAGELVTGTGVKYVFVVTHAGIEEIINSTGGGYGGLGGGGGERGMAGIGGPGIIRAGMTENGTVMWDDAGVIEYIPYGGATEEAGTEESKTV